MRPVRSAALVLALSLAALLPTRPAAAAEPERTNVPVGTSRAIGPATAPVTIIEFLDYQ